MAARPGETELEWLIRSQGSPMLALAGEGAGGSIAAGQMDPSQVLSTQQLIAAMRQYGVTNVMDLPYQVRAQIAGATPETGYSVWKDSIVPGLLAFGAGYLGATGLEAAGAGGAAAAGGGSAAGGALASDAALAAGATGGAAGAAGGGLTAAQAAGLTSGAGVASGAAGAAGGTGSTGALAGASGSPASVYGGSQGAATVGAANSGGGLMSGSNLATLGGAAISALGSTYAANKASKAQSNTTTVPWSVAQPYLERGFQEAGGILNRGYPEETAALLRARGLLGSPATNAAQNLATSTMRGDYLNSNPFLNNAVQDAMGMAGSKINSQFAGNNYGSSAHQEWLGRGLMNAALPYLSQNYENERGRQYAAMAQAPALAGMDYQNIAAMQQADFMPWDFLQRYQQTVGGLNPGGGTTTSQTPYFSNPVNSALGGAMLGNQIYRQYQQPASGGSFGDWMNMGSSTPYNQSGFPDF